MDSVVMVLVWAGLRLAPLVVLGLGAWLVLTRTRGGKALMARVLEDRPSPGGVLALANEVERLRRDVADLQERLNFTERLVLEQHGVLPTAAAGTYRATPPGSAAVPA